MRWSLFPEKRLWKCCSLFTLGKAVKVNEQGKKTIGEIFGLMTRVSSMGKTIGER